MHRVGLLGGTFDPPHMGHLWLGEVAHDQLELDAVWFLPVGDPVHKQEREKTAVHHRIAMTQRAIQNNPAFALSRLDADRPPPHTTVSLLNTVQKQYPDTQFWLLIGGDSLRDFASWVEPAKIVARCRLAVLSRPGASIDWEALEAAVPQIRNKVDWLDAPPLHLSSTALRQRLRQRQTVRYLLPDAVASYIEAHAVYSK